jgi:hypothetical protein
MAPNPLISTLKNTSDGLQVALHPLVLLTISDYVTRHTLRNQKGPVVGALLGQQNGREITIEHAFECLLLQIDGETMLHKVWFEERLQQSKYASAMRFDVVPLYLEYQMSRHQAARNPPILQPNSSFCDTVLIAQYSVCKANAA